MAAVQDLRKGLFGRLEAIARPRVAPLLADPSPRDTGRGSQQWRGVATEQLPLFGVIEDGLTYKVRLGVLQWEITFLESTYIDSRVIPGTMEIVSKKIGIRAAIPLNGNMTGALPVAGRDDDEVTIREAVDLAAVAFPVNPQLEDERPVTEQWKVDVFSILADHG